MRSALKATRMTSQNKKFATARKLLDFLSLICVFLASCGLVVLIATFGWLVFGRYILNETPTWVEQLALVVICYIAFLGAAAGIHENSHLGVSLFRDLLKGRLNWLVRLLSDLVLAIFGAVMFVAGLELFEFGWNTLLPMLNVPESVRTLSCVLCGGLMTLFSSARIFFQIVDAFEKQPELETV